MGHKSTDRRVPGYATPTLTLEQELDALLRRRGVQLTGAEVAAAIRSEEHRRATERIGAAATTSSQPEQDAFLREHAGGDTPPDVGTAMFSAAFNTATETMLTTAEAAALTGKARSTITRRVESREMYAIRSDGVLHLPAWQLTDEGRTVPGLREALAHVPETWGPRRLRLFMTTPEHSLDGRSPVQWLLDGEDPRVVADLMDAETRE
ncbi:hypothetical protein [Intrasporangium sp.]|uniref:hypothetical protein n=1 Tax=Intrasporangium sp. TaxID=1925024 RepID=UPI0032215D7B